MEVTNCRGEVVPWTGSDTDALAAGCNVDCKGCFGCFGCYKCTDCNHCSNCWLCSSCSDCNSCHRCSNCSHCSDCHGCRVQPIYIVTDQWPICIRRCSPTMQIEYLSYPVKTWLSFSDAYISEINPGFLEFWNKWKDVIQLIISKETTNGPQ